MCIHMEENKFINDVSLSDLHDSDAVYSKFVKNGKLCLYIEPKHKKHVKRFYQRHKTFERLNRNAKNSQLWKLLLFTYALWKDVILSGFEPNHEGYKVIKFILMFFWYRIDHMEAEDIDENNVRVTFIPRT